MPREADDLFRREALEHHARRHGGDGALLVLTPRWLDVAWWSTVVAVVVCVAFATFGTWSRHRSVPTVIRALETGDCELLALFPTRLSTIVIRDAPASVFAPGLAESAEARLAASTEDVVAGGARLRDAGFKGPLPDGESVSLIRGRVPNCRTWPGTRALAPGQKLVGRLEVRLGPQRLADVFAPRSPAAQR